MVKTEGFFPERELLAYRRSLLPPSADRGECFLPSPPKDPDTAVTDNQAVIIACLVATGII
jgi:hypothetical protein